MQRSPSMQWWSTITTMYIGTYPDTISRMLFAILDILISGRSLPLMLFVAPTISLVCAAMTAHVAVSLFEETITILARRS